MKVSFFSTAICLASLIAHTTAIFNLGPFPDLVQVGKTYTLTWSATLNYTYTLWLVLESPGGNEFAWTKVSSLATGLRFRALNGSHDWTVPSNLSVSGNYSLWVNGFNIPFNGGSYYDQTDYFKVTTSNVPSTSIRPSASSSVTHGASTSPASSGASHHSISGGAIAGIVIGSILAIALAIGAGILFVRYKRRSGLKKREAAARADRLSSVMPKGSPSYEMKGRSEQIIKETSV